MTARKVEVAYMLRYKRTYNFELQQFEERLKATEGNAAVAQARKAWRQMREQNSHIDFQDPQLIRIEKEAIEGVFES